MFRTDEEYIDLNEFEGGASPAARHVAPQPFNLWRTIQEAFEREREVRHDAAHPYRANRIIDLGDESLYRLPPMMITRTQTTAAADSLPPGGAWFLFGAAAALVILALRK